MSSRSAKASRDAPGQPDLLSCKTCGRGFSRNEHLRRHELIHSNSKPFQCSTCGRDFVRKDALDRHLATHQDMGPSLRQKGVRACLSCATAKVKCSGELPVCYRCRTRAKAQCTYPHVLASSGPSKNDRTSNSNTLSSTIEGDTEQSAGMEGSFVSNDPDTIGANVLSSPVDLGLINDNPFDQPYWEHDFQTTINWLPEEIDSMANDLGWAHFDDESSFPFLNGTSVMIAASEHPSQLARPSFETSEDPQDQGHSTVSPEQTASARLSPGETPLSGNGLSSDLQHVEGELYVDGQPARLPRVKRRRLTTSHTIATPSNIDTYSLKFISDTQSENSSVPYITLADQAYENLLGSFEKVCLPSDNIATIENDSPHRTHNFHPSSIFSSGFESEFPSKSVFELLVRSYMSSFNHLLPIFRPTDCSKFEWQVILATSALGSRYTETTESAAGFGASLHEFLRRVVYLADNDSSWLPQSSIAQAQIRLLYAIGTAYACPLPNPRNQHPVQCLPIDFCLDSWKSQAPVTTSAANASDEWADWKAFEAQNRLGFAIWLTDAMFAIHFQRRPYLSLENALSRLPCHEQLWDADTVDDWLAMQSRYPHVGSIQDALYQLYVQKRLAQSMGEFSRILLVHGLFHRMWEVKSYLSQPLSRWTPTAHRPTGKVSPTETSVWLPSIATFARWRNATCDCIDILHWSANATIGAASGMEHPTVLHLHFSRVVLLTPYEEIIAIANGVTGTGSVKHESNIAMEKQIVRRWAVQDQYKARLAMIHAGVLFWHVRRYSAGGFYEPTAVAMAALVLWAFSVFTEEPRSSKRASADDTNVVVDGNHSDAEEPRCEIILLDRPTDDELVQQYVKEGHQMRAIMKGVGDLCGSSGAERVLVEGRKLLRTLSMWTVSEQWVSMFDKLISFTRDQRESTSSLRMQALRAEVEDPGENIAQTG